MKMAKASERDMDMAMKLCTALESLERGFMPADARLPDEEDNEDFDSEDAEHCYRALKDVLHIVRRGSIGRVVWGMAVLLDPENRVVDPDADTLEDHPDTVAAIKDAARYRWLRERLMAADFDWQESGECALVFAWPKDCAVSGNCDATIDGAMLKTQNAELTGASGAFAAKRPR